MEIQVPESDEKHQACFAQRGIEKSTTNMNQTQPEPEPEERIASNEPMGGILTICLAVGAAVLMLALLFLRRYWLNRAQEVDSYAPEIYKRPDEENPVCGECGLKLVCILLDLRVVSSKNS
jgi:hypothetical protein